MNKIKNMNLQNIFSQKYYNSTILSNFRIKYGVRANIEVEIKYSVCEEKLYSVSIEKINHLLFNMPSEINLYLGSILKGESPLTLRFNDLEVAKTVLNSELMSQYGIDIIDMKLKRSFYLL